MRVLAVDIGSVRHGVAVSDPLGFSAQPLETLPVVGRAKDAARVLELVDEWEAEAVVIGLPLDMSGEENENTAKCRKFGKELCRQRPGLTVHYQDERFTTAEAERMLIGGGVRRKKRRQVVDQTAAVLILRTWLDARQMGGSW